jgi:hypothetical protein
MKLNQLKNLIFDTNCAEHLSGKPGKEKMSEKVLKIVFGGIDLWVEEGAENPFIGTCTNKLTTYW